MKINGLRWVIISLFGIATVINYIDRNALAVMWPGIAGELGMNKTDYAFVVSCFLLAYGIGQGLAGRVFDKIGTRMGAVISIAVWSFAVGLHAFARGLVSFSMLRGLLGLGEAGNSPGGTKLNAEWFPIKERAFAQGIFNASVSVGITISAPLIAYSYTTIGWQATFGLIGALGFLWIIPWLLINKGEPTEHPWLTEGERNYIIEGQKPLEKATVALDDKALTIKELLGFRQAWAVIMSRFFLDPIWWLFVSWLPIYLHDRFGFDVKQIGLFAWMPYVGAALGSLGGGWLSGSLIGKGWTVNRTRKFCIVLGGLFMLPALIASIYASTPLWAMAAIFFALMGFQISIGNIQTLPSDFFSGKSVGTLAGICGTSAVTGVLITTALVPMLTTYSYTPFFILAMVLVPVGIAMVFWLSGEIKRVK